MSPKRNDIKIMLCAAAAAVACGASAVCSFAGEQLDPKTQAGNYYELGNVFYQQGKYEQAQEQYQKALDILKQAEGTKPAQEPVEKEKQTKRPEAVQKKTPSSPATEYTIGEDDELKISVWQNQDLDQEVIVRPDGMISFPLIGDVQAKGLTIRQLTEDVTRLLSEYVRSPQISISLRKMGGSKVMVLGEISKPGVYAVTGARSALEAISLAGGFTKDAVPSSTILIRSAFTKPTAQKLNLSRALAGKDIAAQNIMLQPEDIIFVPKKAIANLNYFLEQFMGPLYQGSFIHQQMKDW